MTALQQINLWQYSFIKSISWRTKTDKILLWFHFADLLILGMGIYFANQPPLKCDAFIMAENCKGETGFWMRNIARRCRKMLPDSTRLHVEFDRSDTLQPDILSKQDLKKLKNDLEDFCGCIGIKKMFTEQMERRFPMPDYEIDNDKREVAVRIYGNAINERYTKLLKDNDNLTLHDCISLDAIQKGHRIDDEIAQDLLKRGLIEGEVPNYTISLGVAKASRQLPQYTKVRGLERDKIKHMILQYIQNAGADGAKRDAILEYLQGTLPGRNTREQNSDLIRNILREMGQENIIVSKNRLWYLSKSTD